MPYQYALSGLVHPERANVNVSLRQAQLKNAPPDMAGVLQFSIIRSQISAMYAADVPLSSAEGLRVWAESAIRVVVDTLGFTNGCGYDVEVTQYFDLNNGDHCVFGVEDSVIASMKISERLDIMKVINLHNSPAGVYLQLCFADLREAIRAPFDSSFFCYRAIESLVHFFMQDRHVDKTAGWVTLQAELGVIASDCRRVEKAAQPLRHGEPRRFDTKERAEIMTLTWQIVEKFAALALERNQ